LVREDQFEPGWVSQAGVYLTSVKAEIGGNETKEMERRGQGFKKLKFWAQQKPDFRGVYIDFTVIFQSSAGSGSAFTAGSKTIPGARKFSVFPAEGGGVPPLFNGSNVASFRPQCEPRSAGFSTALSQQTVETYTPDCLPVRPSRGDYEFVLQPLCDF